MASRAGAARLAGLALERSPGGRVSSLSRIARFYVLSVDLLGLLACGAAWWHAPLPAASFWWIVIAVLAAAGAAPFRIPLPVLGNVTIAFAFVLTALILLGTPSAALAAAASAVTASVIRRGRRPRSRRPGPARARERLSRGLLAHASARRAPWVLAGSRAPGRPPVNVAA